MICMISVSVTMNFQVFILILCAAYVLLFQQTDYKLIQQRLSLDWYNTEFIKDAKVVLFHYTRYEKRINASIFILQDLGYDLTQTVQAYKFQSNEYREFPMLYSGPCCEDAKFDKFGTTSVHLNTNFVSCPINKGLYYAVDIQCDESKFPPFAPRGEFMLEMCMYYKKTTLLTRIKWYIKIDPTNPLEKRFMN